MFSVAKGHLWGPQAPSREASMLPAGLWLEFLVFTQFYFGASVFCCIVTRCLFPASLFCYAVFTVMRSKLQDIFVNNSFIWPIILIIRMKQEDILSHSIGATAKLFCHFQIGTLAKNLKLLKILLILLFFWSKMILMMIQFG